MSTWPWEWNVPWMPLEFSCFYVVSENHCQDSPGTLHGLERPPSACMPQFHVQISSTQTQNRPQGRCKRLVPLCCRQNATVIPASQTFVFPRSPMWLLCFTTTVRTHNDIGKCPSIQCNYNKYFQVSEI